MSTIRPRRNARVALLLPALLLPALLAAAGAAPLGAQGGGTASGRTPLAPNRPVQRELAGSGADSFAVRLGAGQVLDATAVQEGIDVVLSVYGPGGERLDRVDSPNGTQGPERAWLVAPAAGTYRLEITPFNAAVAAGK